MIIVIFRFDCNKYFHIKLFGVWIPVDQWKDELKSTKVILVLIIA